MVRALLFDLDGVLFDGRDFHKMIFLQSVNSFTVSPITEKYHDIFLDGLSTKQKVDTLIQQNLLDVELREAVMKDKQSLTTILIDTYVKYNPRLIKLFQDLSSQYRILCVSNSIFTTITKCLNGLGILPYFHGIISNEDCKDNKPAPDPYLLAFKREGLLPEDCIIFEDSKFGRTSAYASGGWVVPIVDPVDLTAEKISRSISLMDSKNSMDSSQTIHIVVPMAGRGSRFQTQGYTIPKPFIPVLGKPMIQLVIENMKPFEETYGTTTVPPPCRVVYHFIVQKAHLEAYSFDALCTRLEIEYTITPIDSITEGAACTVLLVKDKINTKDPIVIVNSDQYLEWNQNEFYRALLNPTYDGVISVFEQKDASDIKWSYAKTDSEGFVVEVAEKKYISPWATTGIYGWKRGSDFVKFAEDMIAKNIRVNNEFYVCPVYNESIQYGHKVRNLLCKKLWGLGVPEDLEFFLQNYKDESTA
jgi:HAD superfamily hydrolase (TIGR01509 family)